MNVKYAKVNSFLPGTFINSYLISITFLGSCKCGQFKIDALNTSNVKAQSRIIRGFEMPPLSVPYQVLK